MNARIAQRARKPTVAEFGAGMNVAVLVMGLGVAGLDLLHENVRKFGTVFNTVSPGTQLRGVLHRKVEAP